jgi:hypothetical protein
MQPHEQRGPEPKKPDPKDARAKWLLLVIAILLGVLASEIVKRLT